MISHFSLGGPLDSKMVSFKEAEFRLGDKISKGCFSFKRAEFPLGCSKFCKKGTRVCLKKKEEVFPPLKEEFPLEGTKMLQCYSLLVLNIAK